MSLKRYPARGKPLNLQTFEAGNGTFTAGANASALTRDTTRDAGYPGSGVGSLRWTATAAGDSSLSSSLIAAPSSTDVLLVAKLWIGGSGTYSARLAMDYYDTASTYINGEYNYTRTTLAVGVWHILMCPLTMPSNGGYVQPSVTVFTAAAGQQFWLDNVQLTA